jgi:DNA-directed RNA polymerase specialized sigma24 family protein
MICDCQRGLFNCEEHVRRFLGVGQPDGSMDLAARDELIEKMRPLAERLVGGALDGKWRQDRDAVVHETVLKLCDPGKIRTWWESPRRTWFCHWVAVVTYHTAIDWTRRSGPAAAGGATVLSAAASPPASSGLAEQAEELRKAIIAALSEFECSWQLVFCMRFSYLEPCISDIARAVKVSEETVFFRLRKIKERVNHGCRQFLSPAVAKAELVGTRHPVDGFDRMDRDRRDRMNDAIRTMLEARPLKEQLAFHLMYSPMAASPDEIAVQVQEAKDCVLAWLANIEAEIKRLLPGEQC